MLSVEACARITFPAELPISARIDEIEETLTRHPVVIVRGETGSGKTTQIPKLLLKAGWGKRGMIGCTQPRRVAALGVSSRIAEELGPELGKVVGTRIRFTDRTDRHTRIKIMTDGVLLNEMQGDRCLRRYSALVIDEAHERSLNIDFILGHLIQIRKKRPDLRIVVTSATIDTAKFAAAFGGVPVIEVTGRMFPVEVRYRPFEDNPDGGYTFIEAACDAVDDVLAESRSGDLLVFLPSEKDIREVCERVSGGAGRHCEVVPLYGRLTQDEQQRIFRPSQRRRIVVATNIAETSITVSGIRFVIDSGLARISRFSAHTRTQRLPIEPVSRSSADQRKGRCGRVEAGVCIRLYSEEDYLSRPEYTPPEIFRSNLASVVLRMKAFQFGAVEDFPFIDPPEPRAVQGGIQLLHELCAIDEAGELTEIGEKLARIPIDPTIARMLLEARKLHALNSVLVIAAALSIQDPRERPMDKEAQADQEHRKFRVDGSDFLGLLQIWKAYGDQYERWSQSRMRRFCKEHFISYQRLREWREIHAQISDVLRDLDEFRFGETDETPEAIHRSILSGLLGNVAIREEGNWFQATRGRKVMVFPGSVVFEKPKRGEGQRKRKPDEGKPKAAPRDWIMAGEFVETSRLFARTVSRIDVSWIKASAGHLIKHSWQDPHWSSRSQRVLAWRKDFLYGLLVDRTQVGYGSINPEDAKAMFIRLGLIEGGVTDRFAFLEHNRVLAAKVSEMQARFRRSLVADLDHVLYVFYDERLPVISSVSELHRWWRALDAQAQATMQLSEETLIGRAVSDEEREVFPEAVQLGSNLRRVDYRFSPGEAVDGATLTVPISDFAAVREGSLDWFVPGYVADKVDLLLKGLPKPWRQALMPLKETRERLMKQLRPSPRSLVVDLSEEIRRCFRIDIPPTAWDVRSLPEHLQLKVRLVDEKGSEIAPGVKRWDELRACADTWLESQGKKQSEITAVDVWRDAVTRWEKESLTGWSFPDIPREIVIGEVQGIPLHAWPGLVREASGGTVSLRLFHEATEAAAQTPGAYRWLCEHASGRELGWFRRDLKRLRPLCVLVSDLYKWDDFERELYESTCKHLFLAELSWPLTREGFEARVRAAVVALRGMTYTLEGLLKPTFDLRLELRGGVEGSHPVAAQTVARLFPKGFLRIYTLDQLSHFPRYLKAAKTRIQRAMQDPLKDQAKSGKVEPLVKRFQTLLQHSARNPGISRGALNRIHIALEEFRVSVFAQELGTHGKVSEKTLAEMMDALMKGT